MFPPCHQQCLSHYLLRPNFSLAESECPSMESPMAIASGTVWPWVTMICALSDFKVVAHDPWAAGTFGF